ncbi:flagellar biosynthesis protein FlhB [Paenibacillus turpanensis]|uniref:flagellar biosynthesis protein FlhB n=1 Tax=Paenibacillus turpanensis TaxID=2689078 RepID=UPI00140E7FBB|nr:flagellar biosynthesis protein FlhB [Paenibacillus turpanensis]
MQRHRIPINLQFFSQEKTEPATPKKRQEARQKGQVAQSREVPQSLLMLASFGFLFMYGAVMKDQIMALFRSIFTDYMLMEFSPSNLFGLFGDLIARGLLLLAPIFGIAVVVGILGNYLQIGLLFTGHGLQMKFNKLNPITGFKNIFGLRSVVEFLKSLIKVSVIGFIVYTTLAGEQKQLLALANLPLEMMLSYVSNLVLMLGLKVGAVLVLIAVADYFYQKYEYEKSLRMSKQDIKDEYKKSEGDPLIKGKIKEKQRQMALRRMMQEIPKADVVITNPTHFAVAIKYEAGEMNAPVVTAKGQDFVALKIRQIARDNGITTMENKPLARALYAQVEIGQEIPEDLFQAVAEILAYVYKLKGKAASRG